MVDVPQPEVWCGRFRLEGPPLGQGASGVVYPATDLPTGRAVVLKVLHAHLLDAAGPHLLEADARAAGRLEHPHVVRTLGLWSHEGRRFVVSERVDGVPLSQLPGALPIDRVLELGIQLGSALAAAHAVGLVHGDVRPGNVLVSAEGAHLFDFGVAAWRSEGMPDREHDRVRPGCTAPEVIDGGPPTPASDLYGLGVVLARAALGELPWAGATPFAVLGAQRAGKPELAGLPRGLAALIRQLLRADPVRRPVHADAVTGALRRLRRRPQLPVPAERGVLAPARLGGAWVVHGVDPATGAPAWVRAGLGHRQARALVRRLAAEGWDVRATREGLTSFDLILTGLLTVVLAAVVPVVGLPLGAGLGLWWRASGCRPHLRDALPRARTPIPPRRIEGSAEVAVFAAALLFATALLLWLWPSMAVVPAVGVALLAWGAARGGAQDMAERVARGRIAVDLQELRVVLGGVRSLEKRLALEGEAAEFTDRWRRGELDQVEALDGLRGLLDRARSVAAGSGSR